MMEAAGIDPRPRQGGFGGKPTSPRRSCLRRAAKRVAPEEPARRLFAKTYGPRTAPTPSGHSRQSEVPAAAWRVPFEVYSRARSRRLPRLPDRATAAGRNGHRRPRLERPRRPQPRARQLALQPVRDRPSLHVGYALIVAASLLRYGGGRFVRTLGTLYPAFVLLMVVATGNHFFLDAAAGALVAGGGQTRSAQRVQPALLD